MLSPSCRTARLSAGLILMLFAAASVRAQDFSTAMDQFAGRIKQLLDSERASDVALNQFNAPARLSANSSSGIRKALEEGLKKRGVQVKKNARLEISGEYREAEDRDGKSVVKILGRVVEQDTGKTVSD